MADKILNTRIALKYDSLSNWKSSAVKLRPGEVAFAYIDSANGGSQLYGETNAVKQPTVLFKVGVGTPGATDDGTWKSFNELPWASALAADVYGWAKKSEEEFKSYLTELLSQGAIGDYATTAALRETNTKVAANEEAIAKLNGAADAEGSVAKMIADALAGANLDQYATDEELKAVTDKINHAETGLDTKASQDDLDELATVVEGLVEGENSVDSKIEAAFEAANLDQYATDTELKAVTDKINAADTGLDSKASQDDLDALETIVGDENEGLVKDVADLQGAVATKAESSVVEGIGGRVTNLETAVNHAETGLATKASQDDLDELATVVGDENEGLVKDVADLQGAVATKAESSVVEGIGGRVTTLENAVNHAETGLATKASQDDVDDHETRIAELEGTITGLSGAMHFVGVETALPEGEALAAYSDGDVIIVGEKEYVFNSGAFVEFGDVSAEGDRIAALERDIVTKASQDDLDELSTVVGDETDGLVKDVADLQGAVATKAESSVVEGIGGRVTNLETAVNHAETGLATKASQDDLDALETIVGDETDGLVKDVADLQGAVATKAESSVVEGISGKVTALETAVNHAETGLATKASQDDLDEVKTKVDALVEGDNSVDSKIEAAFEAANLDQYATDTELKAVTDKINHAETGLDTKASQDDLDELATVVGDENEGLVKDVADLKANSATSAALNEVSGKVTALETAVNHAETGLATKASQDDLDEVETKVDALVEKFGEAEDFLIMYCGTSTVNV